MLRHSFILVSMGKNHRFHYYEIILTRKKLFFRIRTCSGQTNLATNTMLVNSNFPGLIQSNTHIRHLKLLCLLTFDESQFLLSYSIVISLEDKIKR